MRNEEFTDLGGKSKSEKNFSSPNPRNEKKGKGAHRQKIFQEGIGKGKRSGKLFLRGSITCPAGPEVREWGREGAEIP